MKASHLKYYIGIILILFFDSLQKIMFHNNDMYDIYIFYKHERYLTNILYDIANLFKFSILTYWLISINKAIFKPLFLTSIIIWIFYFLFYNQTESVLIIPIYVILNIIHQKKLWKSK